MLAVLGKPSLDALIDAAVPAAIRMKKPLALPGSASEADALAELKKNYAQSPYLDEAKILEGDAKRAAGQPVQAESSDNDEIKLLAAQTVMRTDPKSALAANTVTWAREFASFGVRVGAVAPGIERGRGEWRSVRPRRSRCRPSRAGR